MSEGRVKGPICGVENCRSRTYEENDDGYLYCQNGHRKGVSWVDLLDYE
jgi:RNA polymerase I-specific transcription initiation factor RRN7